MLISALLLLALSPARSAENLPTMEKKLHAASQSLERHSDRAAIVQSLYEQIRPRANVTDKSLAASEIDRIVRSYVSDRYAPALISNYALLYSKLFAAKVEFSSDQTLHTFKLSEDTLAVLYATLRGKDLQVEYRTNFAEGGWTTSATFVFVSKDDELMLSRIELPFKKDTKIHVDGI